MTIQTEIEKIKIDHKNSLQANPRAPIYTQTIAAVPTAPFNKENERPSLTPLPPKPTKSVESKSALSDIENEINLYKNNERISRQVEEKKKEIQQSRVLNVSFGAQVEEKNIEEEIRALHKAKNQVCLIISLCRNVIRQELSLFTYFENSESTRLD